MHLERLLYHEPNQHHANKGGYFYTLALAPGVYRIVGNAGVGVTDHYGKDIEVSVNFENRCHKFGLADPMEVTFTLADANGELSVFQELPDVLPVHSWAHAIHDEDHANGKAAAHGPGFELEPGDYRVDAELPVAVEVLVPDPANPDVGHWMPLTAKPYAKEVTFSTVETATYRILYPNGGKGNVSLYQLEKE